MMSSALCRGLQTQPTSPTAHHHIWAPARRSYSGISSPVTSTPTKNYFMMGSRRSYSPPRRPQSAPGARQRLSAPAAPEIETEEEYVEFYQKRILTAQQRQLLPLQEDLADWLNKLLGEFGKNFARHPFLSFHKLK